MFRQGTEIKKKTLKIQCFFVGLWKDGSWGKCLYGIIVENENNQFHLLSKCGLIGEGNFQMMMYCH